MTDTFLIEYKGAYPVDRTHKLESPLKQALAAFEAAAAEFAKINIQDPIIRDRYNKHIKRMSETVKEDVAAGKQTVKEGMEFAQQMRNQIMEETRVASSARGKAKAEALKKEGRTLESLLDHKAKQFNKPYSALTQAEKNEVHYSIIESSGKADKAANLSAARWKTMGKVCLVVTASLAVYSIVTADDKVKETGRQAAIIAGGIAGGAVATPIAGVVSPWCGPGAPVCAVAVLLIGGAVGGVAGEFAFEKLNEEVTEFTKWGIR